MNEKEIKKQVSALGYQMGRQYKEIMNRLNEHNTVVIKNLQDMNKRISDLEDKKSNRSKKDNSLLEVKRNDILI